MLFMSNGLNYIQGNCWTSLFFLIRSVGTITIAFLKPFNFQIQLSHKKERYELDMLMHFFSPKY